MFTVTARGVYGLSALIELALNYQQGPKQIKDIASAHGIPQHYLEQILVILKKSGVVESFRGAQGGYALARHPSRIQLLEVLSLLEGQLEVLPEQRQGNALGFFWNALENRIRDFLDRSLEDLLLEMQSQQSAMMYSI
ncbi:RrF2 family transcriptional regulator [Salinispira pacifica]|uniref:Putative transcriptional regulator of cysteine synthase, Rrf2 family n=1 Tax=Salinispira pacifica TaxID=1307761 RepID=V5WJ99_9SPIO|nr:Rrf2 family transcriptional regulator [Salinispira pacifica]AHC15619.1 putative transcriptional regulator of cysteine synthase, Rrf2 family [Salinispira pacifica]